MNRPSNDVFHRIPEQTLRKLIIESTSIRQVFHKMGLCVSGDHYKPFKRRIKALGIDLSHFNGTYREGQFKTELPIERVFIRGTHHSGTTLSRKMLKHGLKEYRCAKCGLGDTWNGETITLQVDHENGDNTDNRIENLRFLCPNCHSQTKTYAGRRHKKHRHCVDCGKECGLKAKRCKECANKESSNRVIKHPEPKWPSPDVVSKAVWEKALTPLAREWGGSTNGLKKHCRTRGIVYPPQGYWRRRELGYSHEESLVSQARIRPTKRTISLQSMGRVHRLLAEGHSLRESAKIVGFHHTTLGRAIRKMETPSTAM